MTGTVERRVRLVQTITIVWMLVETVGSLVAAWRARSPALVAFGGDSLIELFSASVVLWRFTTRMEQEQAELRAGKIAAALLFLLAAYVVASASLAMLGYIEPRTNVLGIAVLLAAAIVMPWLAWEKRRISAATGSAAMRADAAQSALCWYMSVIALAGLVIHSIASVKWADPLAALVIVPFILYEAREALRGRPCRCVS